MASKNSPTSDDWQAALDADDEEAFREAVRPHTDALIAAARHDLDYYADQGFIREGDFTPEEVVGETLIYAWEHRAQRPAQMSLNGWLQGMQYRVLRSLVEEQQQYRENKAISLDEQIPPDERAEGRQERFQYGYQPDAEITWEDVTPGAEPVDIEAPLFTNADTFHLDPDSRHVAMMHDEFEMELSEVASAMRRSVKETAALLSQARTTLHERQAGHDDARDPSEGAPAPPNRET